MSDIYIILTGVVIFLVVVFFFRKNIKKIWLKFPGFEGGIETHEKLLPSNGLDAIDKMKLNFAMEGQVRLINDIETGKKIGNLPYNIRGYSHASWVNSALNYDKKGLEVTNSQKSNWYFEIIKDSNAIYLLGYISQDALSRMGGDDIALTVFAQPWKEFKIKVSISFSEISKSEARTLDTQNGDIRVLDIIAKDVNILNAMEERKD